MKFKRVGGLQRQALFTTAIELAAMAARWLG
jgi:hypothetical protein